MDFGFNLMENKPKKISFQLRSVTRFSVSPSVVSQTEIGPRSSFPGCESGHQTQWRPPVLTAISQGHLWLVFRFLATNTDQVPGPVPGAERGDKTIKPVSGL